MSPTLPGGDEFTNYLMDRIEECMTEFKNKQETVYHLYEKFKIHPEHTIKCWDYFEKKYPDIMSMYTESVEIIREIREKIETEKKKLYDDTLSPLNLRLTRTPELIKTIEDILKNQDPGFFATMANEEQQQQRLSPPASPRLMETDPNASSQQVTTNPLERMENEATAQKRQRTDHLQATSSATGSDGILEQILTSVTKIETTSEQMLKLMTDAAKSREKKPRVEKEKVRGGDNEETENLNQNQNQQAGQDNTSSK